MSRLWVAIQRNPTSGQGSKRAEIIALCTHLRRLGIRPRVFSRRERLAQRLSQPDARDSLVGLIAAGGDGTVADLANRFPGLPMTVLPLGTENLLAKYLGIPADGRFVAEMLARGMTRQFDVGLLNGRRFLLMMTAGFDAEVVHRTAARRGGNIRKWNYVQPIWETIRTYRYPELRVEVEGEDSSFDEPLVGALIVLANLPAYALGLPLAANAVGDDGLLDLRLFQRSSTFQMVRYLYKVARRQHEMLPDVRVGRVRRARVMSDVPVPLQCDGDPAGWTPAVVSVLPGALTLFVPPKPSAPTAQPFNGSPAGAPSC